MQAKTSATQTAETASLLESFGIELSAGGLVVMTDFAKAESAYIHHSTVPVAVVAMAVASPTFARGRFPKLRLVNVVTKVAAMDGREMRALATVCGANIDNLPEGFWPCAGVCSAPAWRDCPLRVRRFLPARPESEHQRHRCPPARF